MVGHDRSGIVTGSEASASTRSQADEDGRGPSWEASLHRGFARHGEGGQAYRLGLASPQGWPFMLDRSATSLT
jgi:hypothetical protein